MPTQRILFTGGAVLCAVLIAVALYFQHVMGLEPCPLCIFQRMFVMALGVLLVIGVIHNPAPGWRRAYGAGVSVLAVLGIVVAGRHVRLQNLPEDQVPECGPGLEFMLEALPFQKMLETVLKGSGECAEVLWTLFGISMPGWSLIWLVLLTLLALVITFRRR